MPKVVICAALVYLLMLVLVVRANRNFWNKYYEVYPQDIAYNDEQQLKYIKEYKERKSQR